jgi:GDPmannose 4,6-dehydratase
MPVALITGITGQDGAYLTRFLLAKGYQVHGLVRRTSTTSDARLRALLGPDYISRIILHELDITDTGGLVSLCTQYAFDEVYHLAAQSHVGASFANPEYTAQVDGLGTLRLLQALHITRQSARFYQASTSELFGNSGHLMQSETTPFAPRSPYACAKLYAYWITVNYRDRGLFACNGILFNHESPLRGLSFVTRSITYGAARVQAGLQSLLLLGNLDARRDWGYAPDYVDAMWRMMQLDVPQDLVIATGQTHTVRDFVTWTFQAHGVTLAWHGSGIHEMAVDVDTGAVKVRCDAARLRPTEVDYLCGDASRAQDLLAWAPRIMGSDLAYCMARVDAWRIKKFQQYQVEDVWSIPHEYMLQDIPDWSALPLLDLYKPTDTIIS